MVNAPNLSKFTYDRLSTFQLSLGFLLNCLTELRQTQMFVARLKGKLVVEDEGAGRYLTLTGYNKTSNMSIY